MKPVLSFSGSNQWYLLPVETPNTAKNCLEFLEIDQGEDCSKGLKIYFTKLRENTVKLLEFMINSLLTFPYWLNLVFRSAALVTEDRLLTHRLFPVSFLSFAEEALFPGVLVVLLSAALESLLLASPVFPFSLKAKWKRIKNTVFNVFLSFNPWPSQIWLLILPSSYYTFPLKLDKWIWY